MLIALIKGGGQNYGKLADIILERSLTSNQINTDFHLYFQAV